MSKNNTKPITKEELEKFKKADKNAAKYIEEIDNQHKWP